MIQYKNILVAVDLIDASKKILKKAAELSILFQSKLNIIHVVEPVPISGIGIGFQPIDSSEVEMELMKLSKKQLKKLAQKYDIPVNRQFVELGSTKHEILRIAEKQKVDLIIVGSHGRHGLDFLLGSTANTIVHHAKCDVLVVRIKN